MVDAVGARAGDSAARVLRALGAAVHVGVGALQQLGALCAEVAPAHTLAVVTDDTVAELPWFEGALASLRAAAPRLVVHAVPPGEASKSRATWGAVTDALLAHDCGRDTTVVALGGGVVGDLAGFVAATFMRGVPVVQVPTTLVAMVDAAIGGKTGVDTPAGKNLVGAFHRPAAVVVDPRALVTLPVNHIREGLAEVLKHGAIADAAYFELAAAFGRRFGPSHGHVAEREVEALWSAPQGAALVARSIEIKGAIVDEDEREAGRREILNFGHTIAHAVELDTGYSVSHGRAVAAGMVVEARIGERLGVTTSGTADVLAHALVGAGLAASLPPGASADAIAEAMRRDKKARRGIPHVALIQSIGRAARHGDGWSFPVDAATVRAAVADSLASSGG